MTNRSATLLPRIASCVVALGLVVACSESKTNVGVIVVAPDGGKVPDASSPAEDAPTAGTCTSAREQLLLPIAKVSTGEVKVISDTNGTKTIYVDASAGGQAAVSKNPRVYIDLAAGARVHVTDPEATASTEWDLALKRAVIFTNSGDAGAAQGGAIQLNKAFAAVTAANADAAALEKETFFDEECNPKLDPVGAPLTTFSDWYAYDESTNVPTPRNVTYVVRGAAGTKYKVGIKAYDGLPDGGSRNNTATGFYILQVTAL